MNVPQFVLVNWLAILALSLFGAVLCARYAYSRSNFGMGLFSVSFGLHAISIVTSALAQTAHLDSFVPQRIGPQTFTAPVLNIDAGTPIILILMLTACYLLGSRLPVAERTHKLITKPQV